MSRSKWKGKFLDIFFLKKHLYRKNIKIWSRSSSVPLSLVGARVSIYNGQKYIPMVVSVEKVGFKFGEFCFTRNHPNLKKQKKGKSKIKTWVKKQI
jgi:small subunit ribosomal protein S19